MATKENVYSLIKNNKEILEKRKRVVEELDAQVKKMLEAAPGRAPAWDREKLLQMDKFCLENEKRCVMWDDEGNGFYLLLNWDWLTNKPRHPPQTIEKFEPGWWSNVKQMLKMPLIDPTVADDKLAEWIDAHTMAVHQFESKRQQLRRDSASGKLVLDDPYFAELQLVTLPAETTSAH